MTVHFPQRGGAIIIHQMGPNVGRSLIGPKSDELLWHLSTFPRGQGFDGHSLVRIKAINSLDL